MQHTFFNWRKLLTGKHYFNSKYLEKIKKKKIPAALFDARTKISNQGKTKKYDILFLIGGKC